MIAKEPSLCNHFWLYPTRRPTQGLQPSHPRHPTFCSFPSHKPHHPTPKKEHSLLVLPSVNTIINFATEFFEMFTKLQSEHPQKVFQVFQVFRVFQVLHFAFGPQNRSVLVQIRTKPQKPIPTHLRHVMATENTQKGNSPTGLRTRYSPVCHSRSCCSAKPTFVLFHPTGYYKIKTDTYSFDGVE